MILFLLCLSLHQLVQVLEFLRLNHQEKSELPNHLLLVEFLREPFQLQVEHLRLHLVLLSPRLVVDLVRGLPRLVDVRLQV